MFRAAAEQIDLEAAQKAWTQLEEFAETLQNVSLIVSDETIPIRGAA